MEINRGEVEPSSSHEPKEPGKPVDEEKMLTPSDENVNVAFPWKMKHVGIGPGKKELGFVEVIKMLQTRYEHCAESEIAYPQKGIWIYERDAQMRRHYKRQYPEFFAPKRDKQAKQRRQEQQTKADRIRGERRVRGSVLSRRPTTIDISTYRERASS